jgi:predicted nucleic acid-binding protein
LPTTTKASDVVRDRQLDRPGLTTYDAAYLELAQRRAIPLATLDARLAEACRAAGVAALP